MKNLILISSLLICQFLTAQIRVVSGGNISLGHSGNPVSGYKIHAMGNVVMDGGVDKTPLVLWDNHTYDYGYAFSSNVNRGYTKALSVIFNGTETFKVMGNGATFVTTLSYLSDRNLKENIKPTEYGLYQILKLQGVTYNFKPQVLHKDALPGTVLPMEKPKQEIGLIAQDVEQIVPEAVTTMENGIKAISYQTLIPVLIEAIKEQNDKITKLESEIAACSYYKNSEKANVLSVDNSVKSYLSQNKPNPFNKETLIDFAVMEEGNSSILFFDMTGKLLKSVPVKTTRKGTVTVTSNEFKPGMYYYSLVVNDMEVDTKKMILTE